MQARAPITRRRQAWPAEHSLRGGLSFSAVQKRLPSYMEEDRQSFTTHSLTADKIWHFVQQCEPRTWAPPLISAFSYAGDFQYYSIGSCHEIYSHRDG